MPHEQFKKALAEALIRDCEQSVLQTQPHTFSPAFERKMQKLIRRREKSYYRIINTAGKRVACAACAVLMISAVSVMKVDALRNAFLHFTVTLREVFSTVRPAEPAQSADALSAIYRITYPLEGYREEVVFSSSQILQMLYVKDDTTIYFDQYTKEAFTLSVNTENAELIPLTVHGNEAVFFCDNLGAYHLIWEEGDTVLYLLSEMNKEQFIEIANSVKIAD